MSSSLALLLASADESPTYTEVGSDDFNRADSTNIGANWDEVNGSVEIVSNRLHGETSSTENQARFVGTFEDDQYAEAKVYSNAGGMDCSVAVRVSDNIASPEDMYHLNVDGTEFDIKKYVGGVQSNISNNIITVNDGDTIRLEVEGTELRAYLNGALQVTANDSDLTSGRPGIKLWSDSIGEIDDFACGNITL